MDRFIEPWEYFVVDNVMPVDVFTELQQELSCLDKPRVYKRARYYLNSDLASDKLRKYLKIYIHPTLSELAVHSFPDLDLSNTSFYDECSIQSKHHKYPIHCDIASKIVSSVFHVSDQGVGTHLYDSNKKHHSTLPWTPNSCMFFVNAPKKFHSFSSDINYRITVSSSIRQLPNRASSRRRT